MTKQLPIYIFLLLSIGAKSQLTIPDILEKFNNKTVEYITVDEAINGDDFIFLDAREREEFEVSHLKNAVWVGYDDFEIDRVSQIAPDKKIPIVVYCSVGVRSEDVGEKLKLAGYTQIRNLYGGIFEWKNQGNPVYNTQNQPTDNVHPFSKYWGQLLTNADKVYNK
ncbi:rhodanese-like domain-containing protein [Flagellimonas algicola]|uniref:Rhodanese-like domain-containing protein n=1 Tax=Flagellimonas algicola TaxID=2583815 RepID=A0ABY2WLY8_9FLAO|nr:rhodanese-like domain-containing protein [Allomuricauda algicola]TMU55522.1 rhodanese-like domain-containing protein [Allomuricauda algicola]